MIISSKQVQSVLKLYGKQIKTENVAPQSEVRSAFAKPDQVAISSESKIKQRAVSAAREAPDLREDKVEQLKQAIASGTYTVSEDEVAEKIVYRSLVDRLV